MLWNYVNVKEQFMKDHDGTKLGFMSFFTKAAVAALKKYPEVNAEIDGEDMITNNSMISVLPYLLMMVY